MTLKITEEKIEQQLTSSVSIVREFTAWLIEESIPIPLIQKWKTDYEPFICLDFIINEQFSIRFDPYSLAKLSYLKKQIRVVSINLPWALSTLQTWIRYSTNPQYTSLLTDSTTDPTEL